MSIEIKKRHGGQSILSNVEISNAEINNTEINISNDSGGLNLYADDGTLLIKGDGRGLTMQDSDGTSRGRFGVQPDGTRDSFFGITAEGEELG